jgi:hypothetical protein
MKGAEAQVKVQAQLTEQLKIRQGLNPCPANVENMVSS